MLHSPLFPSLHGLEKPRAKRGMDELRFHDLNSLNSYNLWRSGLIFTRLVLHLVDLGLPFPIPTREPDTALWPETLLAIKDIERPRHLLSTIVSSGLLYSSVLYCVSLNLRSAASNFLNICQALQIHTPNHRIRQAFSSNLCATPEGLHKSHRL